MSGQGIRGGLAAAWRALGRLYTTPPAPPPPAEPLGTFRLALRLDHAAAGAELGFPPDMVVLLRQAADRLREQRHALNYIRGEIQGAKPGDWAGRCVNALRRANTALGWPEAR